VIETAMMPYYVSRFLMKTSVNVYIALTPNAEDFVSALSLQALSQNPVYTEAHKFNPYTGAPFHLTYSQSDALFVYPASSRILACAALGLIECPVTRLVAHTPKEKII